MTHPTTACRPPPMQPSQTATRRSAASATGRRRRSRRITPSIRASKARKSQPAMSTMAARAPSGPRRRLPPEARRPGSSPIATTATPALSAKPRRPRSCLALPGTLDQGGRAETGEDIDQHHLSAVGLDDFMADDLLAGIVAALHQHTRPDLCDQLDRRVLLEEDDEIDRL